jgi:eukaryotic-like serine/threonine-protein kinase
MRPAPPIDEPLARMGRYVIYGRIASGGMATVHYGRLVGKAGFSRTVGIKRMHPHCSADPEFVSMLVDEAHLVERIRHPNVVPILDVVSLEHELLLVMELVQGESVSRLMRMVRERGQSVPIDVAAAIMHGVLAGLHAAHEATDEDGTPLRIVHRDVSPQNIMVSIDGTARVLDFGIAKATARSQVTKDGQLKGKVRYIAPEQAWHKEVDRRTDVYSASVVFWEMLAARTAFDGPNEVATLGMVLEGRIDPLLDIRADVPIALDDIIRRGMALHKEDRFPSAQAMAIALEQVLPIATSRAVAAWLEGIASRRLTAHSENLSLIERASSKNALSMVREGDGFPSILDEQEESSAISDFDASVRAYANRESRRRTVVGLVLAAVVGGLAVIAYAMVAGDGGRKVGTEPAPSATGIEARAAAAPSADGAMDAAWGDGSTHDATARDGFPEASDPPVHARRPRTPTTTAPVTTSTSTASDTRDPQASCNPPFTIDEEGFRVPKPECLR